MTESLTLATILITVLTSLAAFSSREIFDRFALHPWSIAREGLWYQTITSGFLHGSLGHLLFNMVTLFFFGPYIESRFGPVGFAIIYLGSMLGGSLLTFARRRNQQKYRAIGASGAISGILFGFALLEPLSPIYLMFIPIGIPAAIMAVLFVLVSIFGMRGSWGNIGHDAHLGGAVTGLILTWVLEPRAISIFLDKISRGM